MNEIKKKEGRKGPYYMTNVGGIVYASSNEEDLREFLRGEEVNMVQSGETWFWVEKKNGEGKRTTKLEKTDTVDVKEKIKSLVKELLNVTEQL